MAILNAAPIWLSLAFTAGCIVESPQERDPRVQGDYEDGDEEHRPGQPCLLCHGEGHFPAAPGEDIFAVAGTVYPAIDSDENDGLGNVEVAITDATGTTYRVQTNDAGNFMLEVDGDDDEDDDDEEEEEESFLSFLLAFFPFFDDPFT